MTETTAKSGGSGTSTSPVGETPGKNGADAAGRDASGRPAAPDGSVFSPAKGGGGAADGSSAPKFTRAPGMAPPPGDPGGDKDEAKRPGGPAVAKGSATVPIVTKGNSGAPSGANQNRPGGAGGGGGNQAGRSGVMPQAAPPRTGAAPAETGKRPGGAAGAAAVGAARVTETVRAARQTVTSAAARGPRRARLNLKRIDPWSVMKFSFAVSVVLFIVVVVATSVLYLALDAMGVWGEVNRSLGDLVNASGGSPGGGFRVTAWGVIGTSMLVGAVNVVLFTALATLGAFIYNVCADLVGGVELTLAERD
ncbi:DUF3566 domain-containing protein [Actinoplanes sp. NPDC051633]|uniref:DUF3566 domain-containing protein n=1 Tax=Actinoplanes sp. NPDC051633 TaxID=3155670 RepID=UPI00344896DC